LIGFLRKQKLSDQRRLRNLLKEKGALQNVMEHLEEIGAGLDSRLRQVSFRCERFCKPTPKVIELLEKSETQTIQRIFETDIPD